MCLQVSDFNKVALANLLLKIEPRLYKPMSSAVTYHVTALDSQVYFCGFVLMKNKIK